MSGRARTALVSACVAVAAAACNGGTAHPSGTARNPATPARRTATQVLGEQSTPATIAVTPYERQAFLQLAMEPAVTVAHRTPVLERWTSDPTFAVAGTPAGRFTYKVDWNGDGVADQTVTRNAATLVLTHKFARAGRHTITFWVTDGATGLAGDPVALSFLVV